MGDWYQSLDLMHASRLTIRVVVDFDLEGFSLVLN